MNICNICNKKYVSLTTLSRHKIKIHKIIDDISNIIIQKDNKDESIITVQNIAHDTEYVQSSVLEQQLRQELLVPLAQSNIILDNDNKLISYGNENYKLLTKDETLGILNGYKRVIERYVLLIHFNDRLPLYKSILIKNKNDIDGYIYNNEWSTINIDKMLTLIINTSIPNIKHILNKGFADEYKDEVDYIRFKTANEIVSGISTNKELFNFIKNEIKEILIDNIKLK